MTPDPNASHYAEIWTIDKRTSKVTPISNDIPHALFYIPVTIL